MGPDGTWCQPTLSRLGKTMKSHRRTESHTGEGPHGGLGTQCWPHSSTLHSPHAAVGLAVPRVDADGALAVLHSPHVVAQLAIGRGSGERERQ